MTRLSIAMIVKDEAITLAHCLASIQGLADEVVVVDTGSSDETCEIATSFNVKLSHYPWHDDFAAARNESLRHCTGDWICILDADEAIDALDHPTIRKAIEAEQHLAFRLTVRDYYSSGSQSTIGQSAQPNHSEYTEGKSFSHYCDFLGLRLCKKLEGLTFVGQVHELLDPFLEKKGVQVGNLPAVVHHYGKVFKAREAHKKHYYLELAKAEANLHPESLQPHFSLVIQAMAAGEWTTVLEAAEHCHRISPKVPLVVVLGKAIGLQALGRHPEAVQVFDRVLKAEPKHPLALLRKGVSLAQMGKITAARTAMKTAIELEPYFTASYINLAELEQAQGNMDGVQLALKRGLAVCPSDPALWEKRVLLALSKNDLAWAAQEANTALRACPTGGQGLWHRLVALHMMAIGQAEHGIALIKLGLKLHPDNPELIQLQDKWTKEG